MSRPLHTVVHCDPIPVVNGPPLSREVLDPGPGTQAVLLGEISAVGPAVWNTADGRRPTQAQVDAGLDPQIYTRLQFRITKIYYGAGRFDPNALFVAAGEIGKDVMQSNNCWTDNPFAGRSYLVWLNATQIQAGPHKGWLIGELNAVQDGRVHLLDASPQPVP